MCCTQYRVDIALVRAIGEFGLVDINEEGEQVLVPIDGLAELERVLRLHTDLGINLEGIAAIETLLQRVQGLEEELRFLRSRLKVYE
jgi:chaperone modulatory protein CbpM